MGHTQKHSIKTCKPVSAEFFEHEVRIRSSQRRVQNAGQGASLRISSGANHFYFWVLGTQP
jgi:hypothetical protein